MVINARLHRNERTFLPGYTIVTVPSEIGIALHARVRYISPFTLRVAMPEKKSLSRTAKSAAKERVRVLITGARIQRRIQELAKEIRRDFPGEPLHLVSVLKGGVFF